jgi:hypothetical protein
MIYVDRDGNSTIFDEEQPDREPFQVSASVPPEIRDQMFGEFLGRQPGWLDRVRAMFGMEVRR